jgi:adenosylhomocysteine nucleosidase
MLDVAAGWRRGGDLGLTGVQPAIILSSMAATALSSVPLTNVAVLFALRQEARAFLRALPAQEKIATAPCRTRLCAGTPTLLVVETGVGQERMHTALDWMFSSPLVRDVPYAPGLVISAGFSGALREGLHVGDIVVATEVVGPDGVCHEASWPTEGNVSWPGEHHRGRLLTVDKFIADPETKRALGLRHAALAVDMETATVACRCNRLDIPFACIRVISDDAHVPLSPELDYIADNGRVVLRRLAVSLLRRPALARELWRLAGNTRFAADRLGRYLGEFLQVKSES